MSNEGQKEMSEENNIREVFDIWTPRYIVTKAPGVGGSSIPKDEPVLVIRAQDMLSLKVMDFYMDTYIEQVPNPSGLVIKELRDHRKVLKAWRTQNFAKLKFADR